MYNFSFRQTIPSRPSIAVTVGLKPWFEPDVIDEGLTLIRENVISHFFIYREVAGALFDNRHPLIISFEKTSRIAQGFTIKTEQCSLCSSPRRRQKRCVHIAALCLLSFADDPDDKVFPMPLGFRDSIWSTLAGFLHDWLSREKGELEYSHSEKGVRVERRASEGSVTARLSPVTSGAWYMVDPKTRPGAILKLYESAQKITATESESHLNAVGSTSRLQERDRSFWAKLCTLFYGFGPRQSQNLFYDQDSGLFQLLLKNTETTDTIHLLLPRSRTVEMIRLLGFEKSGYSLLPPVRQGFSVVMNDKGQVTVAPVLWQNKQRPVLLAELQKMKYGSYYYSPGEGFFSLKQLDPKCRITRPSGKQSATPLFDFLEQDSSFQIPGNELETFLNNNRHTLSHDDNHVDRDILYLQVKSLPDSLIVHDFKEDQDWYYLSCEYGLGSNSISLETLLDAKTNHAAHRIGTTSLQLKNTPLSWFYDLALERSWIDSKKRRGVRLRPGELVALLSTIDNVSNRLEDQHFHARLQSLMDRSAWNNREKHIHVPDHLRSYQKNGLAWLYSLYDFGFGGLLADDMGLGKTHQGLALLETVRKKRTDVFMLVVCPASVLYHWQEKIERFYPDLNAALYYGPDRNLAKVLETKLLLTTYGIARSDQESLSRIRFEIILLDEIQNLKNQKTAIHRAVDSLQSRIKIGLSGTPIENSLSDLYALYNICLPGMLGTPHQFRHNFLVPITEHHDEKQKKKLSRLIEPFILRRSRAQVLEELPELIEDNRLCELSDDQLTLYHQSIDEQRGFLEELEEPEHTIDYMNLLTLITRLKQICNHPCLLERNRNSGRYKSGKWDLFVDLLNESLASGLKVVVFSQYTGMLDIIEYYLEESGIGYAGLRGSMSIAGRKNMIERFTQQPDCMVFSSSLLAGGTGIDLQAGRVVIHYDRWWNPAKEQQATARVHRMGQKEVVQLFRLITAGTLEDKIHQIITSKQNLASSIINEDEGGIIKHLDHSQLVKLFR